MFTFIISKAFDVILLFLNSSTWFIKSNRFEFLNHQEEFETVEWGNPKHILSESTNIFYRNTRRIRGELNKYTGRMQNSLRILFKNLVCNGTLQDYINIKLN